MIHLTQSGVTASLGGQPPKIDKIPYPFEFDEIRLTDEILEGLGLSEWYGGAGDFHDGTIYLCSLVVRLHSVPEDKDETQGYGDPTYNAEHFSSEDFKRRLYFLHDLYEEILIQIALQDKKLEAVKILKEFESRCEHLNLTKYLKSYANYSLSRVGYLEAKEERYIKFHTFLTNLAYPRRGKPEEHWTIEDASEEARMLIDEKVGLTFGVEKTIFEQANALVALGFYIRVDYEKGEWYYIIQKLPKEKDIEFANSGECQDGDLRLDPDTVFNSFPKGYRTYEEALTFGLKDIYEFYPELKPTHES